MAQEYPYILIAGNYYCARHNLLSLARVLLFKNKNLYLKALGIRQRHIPALLKAIWNYRLSPAANTRDVVTLPIPGHLCIPVHHGYKVFNFSKLTATKIFLADVDPGVISAEIACVHDASPLPFTPTLLEVDQDGRWYTESYAPGERSAKTSRSDPEALFEQTVCGHLAGIIQSKAAQTITLTEYLADIRSSVSRQLTESNFDDNLRSRIYKFIQQTADKLEKFNDVPIRLTFTHGDFSFVNFIYGRNGITVIDWEGAKHRSILHDLYNYFFTELYYGRISTMRHAGFTTAIRLLNQRLVDGGRQLSGALTDPDGLYRWLYYLERIQMLMDRQTSSTQRNVILQSIDTFGHFETRLS